MIATRYRITLSTASVLFIALVVSSCSNGDARKTLAFNSTPETPAEAFLEGTSEPTTDGAAGATAEGATEATTGSTTDGMSEALTNVPESEVPTPETQLPAPESAEANSGIEYAAQLFVAQTNAPTAVETVATARFYRLNSTLDAPPRLKAMGALDFCEVGSEASQINPEALDYPIDHMIETASATPIQIAPVSAGQSIELNSDSGSYLSLQPIDDSTGGAEYSLEGGKIKDVSVPAMVNVLVAGDAFPAHNWRWDKPKELQPGLVSAIRGAASNPQLTWEGVQDVDNTQSRLHIYAGYINELTGAYQSFQCELKDDGEYTLPSNIQDLYSAGFSAQFVDVARYTRTLETVDGISTVSVFVQSM